MTDHARWLLKEVHHLWKQSSFCDVVIAVNNVKFPAHRLVLSASSPYFQAMFLGQLKETKEEEITMHGLSVETLSSLLTFIYTGDVTLSIDNCQDVLIGADMLGLSGLLEQCSNFLLEQLDASNCLGISRFAESHGCYDLKKEAISFAEKHFLDMINEEEFLLLPEDWVIKLLQSEFLQVDNEYQVFEAAMKWILHDSKNRRRSIFSICSQVRLPIISSKQLKSYIQNCPDLSLQVALQKIMQDLNKKGAKFMISLKPFLYQPRKFARKSLFVLGGYSRDVGARWSDSESLCDVHCLTLFDQAWTELPKLQHSRSGHGACVIDGRIYVVGGERESLIFDTTEVFYPVEGVWDIVCSLTTPRCSLSICTMDGYIYAMGGWIGSEIGATVERYDVNLDLWIEVDRMKTLRFAMGAVAHEGLIYLAGGTSEMGTELRLFESYNPVTKEWLELPKLRQKRAYVSLVACDNVLYAVGGWNEDSGALNSVEKYDIDKMKWESVPCMSVSRAGAAVAAVNGYLYVMGGRTSTPDAFTAPATLASCECYDPNTETWIELGHMPISRCEASVAVL